jgi:hypothetical protein
VVGQEGGDPPSHSQQLGMAGEALQCGSECRESQPNATSLRRADSAA